MRAQLSGQIFVYIFAIVVAGAILILGYKGIGEITKKAGEAELVQLKSEIQKDIGLAKGYGTEKKNQRYAIPGYRKMCFADNERITAAEISPIPESLIRSSIKPKSKEPNVFLWPKKENDWFYMEGMGVKNNYLCVDASSGSAKVSIVGCGDRAVVTDNENDGTELCAN